jgi:hypothetical protein
MYLLAVSRTVLLTWFWLPSRANDECTFFFLNQYSQLQTALNVNCSQILITVFHTGFCACCYQYENNHYTEDVMKNNQPALHGIKCCLKQNILLKTKCPVLLIFF